MAKKSAMLVNGQFPGPTIRADWGDIIEVRVTNKLKTNGYASSPGVLGPQPLETFSR